MKHKNSIRPLKSPGKNSSGLTIWCGQCKRQIGQSCQGKNAAISSCDHLDKHKYKVVLRVPGQKQKKLTKNLETRNLDEARIQASILKREIRENGNSKVEIERPKPQNSEKPLLLSEAIANYKAYLDNENVPIHLQVERSNEFIKDAKRGLDYLSQRMVNIGHNLQTFRVSDLNDHVVGDIYAGLKERGFSARTVNKYMGYYFSFLKYYSKHHIPTINYFGHGKREPLSPKPQSISKQEFDDLIRIMTYENGFRYYDGKKGERNFFRPYLPDAMYLLLETGRRREEVGKLKWTNVDEEEGVITSVFIFSHLVPFLYKIAKTTLQRRLLIWGSLAFASLVFWVMAILRTDYLANHDVHLSPLIFTLFNLFFFVVSSLVSFFMLPTWAELKEQTSRSKILKEIENLEKEVKQIQIERQKIDEERQENLKDCSRMKSYYNSLMDRLRKMYFETIELYKATNRTYRKDGIIPVCFSDVLPQPDIKDISFTNFNY